MRFIVVLALTPEGRLAKYAAFRVWADAEEHRVQYEGSFILANTTRRPLQEWVVDPDTLEVTFEPVPVPVREDSVVVQAIKLLAEDASPATKAAVLALL